jgi:hypothetical protein
MKSIIKVIGDVSELRDKRKFTRPTEATTNERRKVVIIFECERNEKL